MTFEPVGNRVMLDLDEVGDQTEGGLFLPQTATQEGPKRATVKAVSDGWWINGTWVTSKFKVGDKVLVDQLGGQVIKLRSREYLVVRNEDILGRIIGE